MDLRLHGLAVEPLDVLAERAKLLVVLAHFVAVRRRMERGGDVDDARAFEVAVDVVATNRGFDFVQVLQAQILENGHLFGEALLGIRDAVRQRRLHEATVATACRRAHLVGVDQDDVARRVAFLCNDRRPQAGVAAADDAQVATLGAHQRWVRIGFVGIVVPIRIRIRVGDGVEMTRINRRVFHGFTPPGIVFPMSSAYSMSTQ